MRRLFSALTIASVLVSGLALASSHREAPFITKNPKVDGTDFYLFNSYETGRSNFVTLIANYQPLQDAYGGPNYFSMDPEALYEIHIDNTGEGVEDITFQFRFNNTLSNNGKGYQVGTLADGGLVPIPLINAAPIGTSAGMLGGGQGLIENYTVNVVRGGRRTGTPSAVTHSGGATFQKPLDNIGTKTFPDGYAGYANQFIYTNVTIPGCSTAGSKIFVGQRREGFAVNLGTIFDLVNAPATVITNDTLRDAGGPNPIGNKNVTTIALEIPKACLTAGTQTVIGGWTTASVRQARVVNPAGGFSTATREGGAWTQVSRLGMPLVNEVVIGVPDKDKFNASEPKDDLANFATYVLRPTLPALINALFGVPAPTGDRADLVTAFLTGVPGVNAFTGSGLPPTEMQRLNTALPVTAAASQNSLGALQCFVRPTDGGAPQIALPPSLGGTNGACDPAGFPNGRRPGDDVVDIALRVTEGALLPIGVAPGGSTPFHDAIQQTAGDFDVVFPYMKTPNSGT